MRVDFLNKTAFCHAILMVNIFVISIYVVCLRHKTEQQISFGFLLSFAGNFTCYCFLIFITNSM